MSNSSNFTFSPLNLKYFTHILGIYHVLKLQVYFGIFTLGCAYSFCDGNTVIRLVRVQYNVSMQVQAIFKIIYMEK